MFQIPAREGRMKTPNIYLQDGDFRYRVKPDYIEWPDGLKGIDVLCIYCDEDDLIYICTGSKDYPICIFSPEGKFLRAIAHGVVDRPHCYTPTNHGTFLIADSSEKRHIVAEVDKEGKLLRTFGTDGVPSDSGYNPNKFNELKAAGAFTEAELTKMTREYTDWLYNQYSICRVGGPFNRPCAMAQASTGEYFAADGYGNCAVHKFDKDGNYVKSWGGAGNGEGQFVLPHWLTIDKYDRIWVSDRENSRVHCYNTDGELIGMVEGGYWRTASICATDKYLLFGELRGGFTIVDIDTLEILAQFGFQNLNLMEIHGLCTNSKGDIFITSIKGLKSVGNVIKLEKF